MIDSDEEELSPYEFTHRSTTGLNYEDIICTPPISKAIYRSDVAALRTLIQGGYNPNIPDNNGNVPLHIVAVRYSRPHGEEMMNILLEHSDINVNCQNHPGETALLSILRTWQTDLSVMRLIEAGSDINVSNCMETLPIHIAAKRSSSTIALELIRRGTDINAQDANGYTPLHYAVEKNNLETVCMLLWYSADVSIKSMFHMTPIMYALNDINLTHIARALFDYYDDFSCTADDGYTALLLAANSLSPLTIDIVKAGADVNCFCDNVGNNLLLCALHFPTADLFKLIWKKFDKNILLRCDKSFISVFMGECFYPVSDWLHCLYLILGLDIIFDLLQDYPYSENSSRTSFLWNMIYSLFTRSVGLSDRLAIIYHCLSMGVEVCASVINLVNELYGLNEELEVFIELSSHINLLNKGEHATYCLLPTFIFVQVDNYSPEQIVKLFSNQIVYYVCTGQRVETKNDILNALGYFSLPYTAKQQIIKSLRHWPHVESAVSEKLKAIPELPSLSELCRNQIRKSIQHNHNIQNPCQFHKAVQNLNFPSYLKDIIRFKEPLY